MNPCNRKTRLRIASLSKPITSAAVMLLVERGQLKLDDTVLEVLGDAAPAAKDLRDPRVGRITVRQLLEHRGGWDRTESQEPMFERFPLCPSRAKRFLETTMLDFVPGERSAYSSVGYCILGRVIEKVSNKSYGDFVKEAIAEPLGIKSFALGTEQGSLADEGQYFATQIPGVRTLSPYGGFSMVARGASGGWITTAAHYLRFLNALDGTRKPALLKPETYAELTARPDAADSSGKPTYYAKGLSVRPLRVGANIWHRGSFAGTMSFAAKLAAGWSYAAIFNQRPENFEAMLSRIDRMLSEASHKATPPAEGDLFAQ